jgi:2-methylisocitrate lyase-like PEP mutase family enzyme
MGGAEMTNGHAAEGGKQPGELRHCCALLRSLHMPGSPLILPNAWDVASARAVVAAGFPVVATTSGGIAAVLGYEDHEAAPAGEMFAAARRISSSVAVPVTIDAEAGYGMEPAEVVTILESLGAAGCNLEDTNHGTRTLRDPLRHAQWLREIRTQASNRGYDLVINARIDVFLSDFLSGSKRPQAEFLTEALRRAEIYFEAGADCVFPIALWETETVAAFLAQAPGPVNILSFPRAPSLPELTGFGVARVSYGSLLHRDVMEKFKSFLASLAR